MDDFPKIRCCTSSKFSGTPKTFERLKELRDRLSRQPKLVAGWSDFIEKLKARCAEKLYYTSPDARACIAYCRDLIARTIGNSPQLKEGAFASRASGRAERLNYGLSEVLYGTSDSRARWFPSRPSNLN